MSKLLLPAGHTINAYQHLLTRIDGKQVNALVAANKQSLTAQQSGAAKATPDDKANTVAPIAETITIDDFSKIDLRVAQIVNAEHVDGADKLLKLTLDVGSAAAYGICRHQIGVRPGTVERTHDRHGRQSGSAPDEIRPVRRHGARSGRWW